MHDLKLGYRGNVIKDVHDTELRLTACDISLDKNNISVLYNKCPEFPLALMEWLDTGEGTAFILEYARSKKGDY
mgnify:CR=1 FL=1